MSTPKHHTPDLSVRLLMIGPYRQQHGLLASAHTRNRPDKALLCLSLGAGHQLVLRPINIITLNMSLTFNCSSISTLVFSCAAALCGCYKMLPPGSGEDCHIVLIHVCQELSRALC